MNKKYRMLQRRHTVHTLSEQRRHGKTLLSLSLVLSLSLTWHGRESQLYTRVHYWLPNHLDNVKLC